MTIQKVLFRHAIGCVLFLGFVLQKKLKKKDKKEKKKKLSKQGQKVFSQLRRLIQSSKFLGSCKEMQSYLVWVKSHHIKYTKGRSWSSPPVHLRLVEVKLSTVFFIYLYFWTVENAQKSWLQQFCVFRHKRSSFASINWGLNIWAVRAKYNTRNRKGDVFNTDTLYLV